MNTPFIVPRLSNRIKSSGCPENLLDSNPNILENVEPVIPIEVNNWPEYDATSVAANCKIGWSDSGFFLEFFCIEPEIRVTHAIDGSPVYQDSCVEFFCSLGEKAAYYNFEFNPDGVCLAAFGADRYNRTSLLQEQLREIVRIPRKKTSTASSLQKNNAWNLALFIPFAIFKHDFMPLKKGDVFWANFYKCGDLLLNKHYLSWQPIPVPKPDFHRPEFFGSMVLG